MSHIELSCTTGNQKADQILQGIVGIFEIVFSHRIRGYYLRGSYADSTSLPTSDLDMDILFKDGFMQGESEKAWRIRSHCNDISPIELDLLPVCETTVLDRVAFYGMRLKHGSLLIYGDDIRDQISIPPKDVFVRELMHNAFRLLTRIRQTDDVLIFPLGYPNVNDSFYGYIEPAISCDFTPRSTSNFIRRICWTATAIVAMKTGRYPAKKNDAIRLYREHVNDEWASFLEEIWERCRNEWQAQVPKDKGSRQHFRDFCQRALAFENDFMGIYRDFLLLELQTASVENQLRALKQFNSIMYLDDEVLSVLHMIENRADGELHTIAVNTIGKIAEMRNAGA